MTRTGLAMPDGPEDWDHEPLPYCLLVPYGPAGSLIKQTLLRSLASVDLDIIVPIDRNWLKKIGLDVVKTSGDGAAGIVSHDHYFESAVNRCQVHEVKTVPAVPGSPPWYARISPRRLTGIAVFIAGRERTALDEEWRAHLSEKGAGLSADRQAMEAAGFVRAAVLCRAEDAEDWLWGSVDAVLGSRWLSSPFVLLVVVGVAVIFIRQGGLYGLADNLGSVAVVFGAALGMIHVGRKWRGVKPPKHEPRSGVA